MRDVFCIEVHYDNRSATKLNVGTNDVKLKINIDKPIEIENRKVVDQYCWQIQKPVTLNKLFSCYCFIVILVLNLFCKSLKFFLLKLKYFIKLFVINKNLFSTFRLLNANAVLKIARVG